MKPMWTRVGLMQGAAALALAGCTASQAPEAHASGPPFTMSEVATFQSPWALDFLPGSGTEKTNMALLSERHGRLWLVDVATGKKTEVAGVPQAKVAGQGGLGDVVADPDFAGNRRVYLSYAEPGEAGLSGAALGYGTLEMGSGQPRLANFKVIWRQSPKIEGDGHFSHRIAFGPDGFLYLTSGDRMEMTPAQDLGGNLGKVLRLTKEGQPAPGNPWAARGGVASEAWTMGHRNMLGIAFSPDGRLWVSEMGPEHGDEINLIIAGRNYGWPKVSNGSHYGGGEIPDHKPGDGYEAPKIWWNPAISPGGLLIYTGDLFKNWKGDALVPALSGQALIRVDLDGDNARKADQWNMGARIRAADQGPDGAVYLLVDERSGGKLVKLSPRN
jgi:aldose sugar dehydrogenase